MRAVESATWTSGEPVSLSARLYSAINLPLTSVSAAKPKEEYTCDARLTSRYLLGRAVGPWIGGRTPSVRAIDHDRLRVPERMMVAGHQLKRPI